MTATVTQDLLATLDTRYKALKAEIEEVKRLRAAIKAASGDAAKPVRKRTRSASDGPTFKEMIKSVLADRDNGAEALEILDLIKTKFGKEIKRTSISPQLSRLKASGDLVLQDKVWMLPTQAHSAVSNSLPGMDDYNANIPVSHGVEHAHANKPTNKWDVDMERDAYIESHHGRNKW